MQIIYFDGLCVLCNGFVDYLLKHDRNHRYKFASLQGVTAASRLPESMRVEPPPSLVLQVNDHLYTESSAAIRILAGLGALYRGALLLLLVPVPLRNAIYRWVARNRYKWFGKRSVCRLPNEHERPYFLD